MSTPSPTDDRAARLKTMITLWGVMLAGAALAVAVVAFQRSPVESPSSSHFYLALGVAALIAVTYHFVVYAAEGAQRRRLASGTPDPAAWYGAYQTVMVIGLAMLEAGVITMLFLYWNENPDWRIRLAAIGFAGFMATLFPTRAGVERWIKEQQDMLQRERSGRH